MLNLYEHCTTFGNSMCVKFSLYDIARNIGAKLIIKHFSTSVAIHFYTVKITKTLNALPDLKYIISRKIVNSGKNRLDKKWKQILHPDVRMNLYIYYIIKFAY